MREPLGEVMGNPVFTCAVSGEVIPEIRAKTTKGVREELAGLNCCSAADIVLLKAGEVVNDDQHIDAEVEVLVQNSPPRCLISGLRRLQTRHQRPTDLGHSWWSRSNM